MAENENSPLFETRPVKGRFVFKLFIISVTVGIGFICAYRLRFFPVASGKRERCAWIGLFLCELWFSFYWFITLICRWNPVYRFLHKNRLSQRYVKETLPGVDIFVCTADPSAEPPVMVMNTVLSLLAYDYPPEKLNIYLSDDGASDLTFYAMLEASSFSKQWLPFCKKFKVEPRSPEAYFQTAIEPDNHDPVELKHWLSVKKLYDEANMRIKTTRKKNKIPEDIRKQHKGFREWDFVTSRNDHQTILQILIDGRDPDAVDIEENVLPTLVYLAREKRPQYHHHFKAGAMNALIRVSARISNSPIILNVDCDMYSNNSESIKDSLCFFMDEEKGHEIAFVQHPQTFHNLTNNDIYGNSLRVARKVEFPGLDANGGPCYIGTGCFHRREALSGKKYDETCKVDWKRLNHTRVEESTIVVEETCKVLASCSFEQNSPWGKEMGLKYGCPAEDIITGLSIQCRGWKSIFLDSERESFLGIAPISLLTMLVQHKRWAEGHFQIFLSRYCPLLYGHNRIPLTLQLCYCSANLWAANSLPTLYYVLVPCICLLRDIPLFPEISSPWVLPFAYVSIAHRTYCLGEFMWCGGTFQAWCNDQRIWLFKRTTSYFFAFFDTVLKLLGCSKSAFVITPKVADGDVSRRYKQELMEFGDSSPMFDVLASLAMLNLFGIFGVIKKLAFDADHDEFSDRFGLQIVLCLLLVGLNWPVYKALFFRKDKGRMPASVTYKAITYALLVSTLAL
ncbi:cellulose synthase-like protein E6 [Hibiscus syriacus]|uniref:cellulose synthase-like protein E6 n=1 Tax=Hibiscus syriacus TaxID=106335 RepID=UPI0019209F45|nr:cellulose synthase-like protein E6 [Hibiscus syriacus]